MIAARAASSPSLYPPLLERTGEWFAGRPWRARTLVVSGAVVVVAGAALALTGHWTAGVALAAIVALPAVAFAFVARPVHVFLLFWCFEVLKQTLAATAGSGGGIATSGTRLSQLVQQSDDAVMAVFVAIVAGTYLLGRAGRREWMLVGAAAVCLAAGVVSGLFASGSFRLTLLGAWLGLKLFTWLLVAAALPWSGTDVERVHRWMTIAGVVVVIFAVIDLLFPDQLRAFLATGALPHQDFRASSAVQSIFPNPGRYSFFAAAILAVVYGRFLVHRRRSDLVLVVVFFAGILVSERVKGLASLVTLIVLVPLIVYGLRRIPVRWVVGATVIVVAGVAAMLPILLHQISVYADVGGNPRGELYLASLRIAQDHVPLGVGFGHFASYLSIDPYSQVYVQYGLSHVYGLSSQTKFYLLDTSWPAVLGETGWLGLAAYVGGVGVLAWLVWRRVRAEVGRASSAAVVGLGVLIVVLVDSVANNTLFDATAVCTLAITCGPLLAFARRSRSGEVAE